MANALGGGPLLGQNGVFARRVEKKSEQAIGNYTLYQPEIIIDGSHPHPSILVESQAMSGVHLAQTDYIPLLPERTITSGAISKAQFEDIVLDENAHKQIFPNGERRGFFLGAGTGYGKGRNHSIILDNFNKGRKKAVWVSVNEKAHYDSAKIIKYSIQRCE
ncbi:MAG: strawberry notch family protein [Candidatus Paceibacterota bacterium]